MTSNDFKHHRVGSAICRISRKNAEPGNNSSLLLLWRQLTQSLCWTWPVCCRRVVINNWNVDSAQWSGSEQAVCAYVWARLCVTEKKRSQSLKGFIDYSVGRGQGCKGRTDMKVVVGEWEGLMGSVTVKRLYKDREKVWYWTAVFHGVADMPSIPPSLNNVGGVQTHTHAHTHIWKSTTSLSSRATTCRKLTSAGTFAAFFRT